MRDSDEIGQIDWDVVVVGAGPAGCIAAIRCADQGLRVLLVERKRFPRTKVCGGCLNRRALKVLSALGLSHIARESSGVVTDRFAASIPGKLVEFPVPAGMAICRTQLDEGLVRAAIARGVTFRDGASAMVEPGQLAAESLEVTIQIQESIVVCRAKVVVLAAGLDAARRVAPGSFSSRTWQASRIGAGTVVGARRSEVPEGTIRMCIARGGYAGAVRLADGRLVIAAALDADYVKRSGTVASAVHTILDANGLRVDGLEDANFQGTPTLTRSVVMPAARRIFVVGDAAGYVEPFTGEGMASAMISGMAVAPFVEQAAQEWHADLPKLWAREYRTHIAERQWWTKSLAILMRHSFWTHAAAVAAERVPALPRRLAERLGAQSAAMVGGVALDEEV